MTQVQIAQARGSARVAELLRVVGQRALIKWPDTGRLVWVDKRRLRGKQLSSQNTASSTTRAELKRMEREG